jgi:hypothetical protein
MVYKVFETKLLLLRVVLHLQAVPTAKGQALADEFGIKFFETVSDSSSFMLADTLHCIKLGGYSPKTKSVLAK